MRKLAPLLVLLAAGPGCGVLIGNVRPVDEKASGYRFLDLSRESPDWKLLPSRNPEVPADSPAAETDISDVAFQDARTASVISLNSACRPSNQLAPQDLRAFTQPLLLGLSEPSSRSERELTVDGLPALETTLRARMNGKDVKLRTVVVRRGACVYDLMYFARPERFSEREDDFARFVAAVRLR